MRRLLASLALITQRPTHAVFGGLVLFAGSTFRMQVTDDIRVGDSVLIPKGTAALGAAGDARMDLAFFVPFVGGVCSGAVETITSKAKSAWACSSAIRTSSRRTRVRSRPSGTS